MNVLLGEDNTIILNSSGPVVTPKRNNCASSVPLKPGLRTVQKQRRVMTSNDKDYLSFVSSKMLEAVKVTNHTKQMKPSDKLKKVKGSRSGPACARSSSINDPNEYVTPVFTFDNTNILDRVMTQDNTVTLPASKRRTLQNNDVTSKKGNSQSSKHKPFKLRNKKRKTELVIIKQDSRPVVPPKARRRLIGKESEIRQQLASKFTAAASITFARKEMESLSSQSVPTVSDIFNAAVTPVALSQTNSKPISSKCKLDSKIKSIKSVVIEKLPKIVNAKAATPRCSSLMKPSRQNISNADPARKKVGTVQSMFSSAITKVLHNTPPSKINNILGKGNKSESLAVHSRKQSRCPIPVGFGRPSWPGTLPRNATNNNNIIRHDDCSSSDDDLILANGKPPWEVEEENETDNFDEYEGSFNDNEVKVEIVVDGLEYNDESENCDRDIDEGEEDEVSQDPLDTHHCYSADTDLVKTEVIEIKPEVVIAATSFEYGIKYDTTFLNDFRPEQAHSREGESECHFDPLVDVKPDLTLMARGNETGCSGVTISNVGILTSSSDHSLTTNPKQEEIVIKPEPEDEEYII